VALRIRPCRPKDRAVSRLIFHRTVTKCAVSIVAKAERLARAGSSAPVAGLPPADGLSLQRCFDVVFTRP
jgi:hypothetical protein